MRSKSTLANIDSILLFATLLSMLAYPITLVLLVFSLLPIRSHAPTLAGIIAAGLGILYLLVRTYRLEQSKPQEVKDAERRPRLIERLYMITLILSLLAALAHINGSIILVGSGTALFLLTRLTARHFTQMAAATNEPIPPLVWVVAALPALIVIIIIVLFVGSFRLF